MDQTNSDGRRDRPSRHRRLLRRALRGRRVLLTGGSSGIGRAFALQAAEAGADLALVARRADALSRVADDVRARGGRARIHPVDLADLDAVADLATTLSSSEPIDVLVHNAGLSIRRPVSDLRRGDLERLVAVDYLGAAVLTLGLLPSMRARASGHIVHVSTIGVLTGAPLFAGYVAAKAAADHFFRTLGFELAGQGIRVTRIAMPLVRTPMMAPSRIYRAFPALSVDDAAQRIGRAIARRPARVAPRWATALEMLDALAPSLLSWAYRRGHEPFHAWMRRRLARIDRSEAAEVPAEGHFVELHARRDRDAEGTQAP